MPPTPKAAQEAAEPLTLEQVALKADAAMAQALAIAQEAGELLGALSQRVTDLEQAAPQNGDADLAARVAVLERHTTIPQKPDTPPVRALCDDCGAPLDGQHFDDCAYLPAPQPKGPRGTAARVGAEA